MMISVMLTKEVCGGGSPALVFFRHSARARERKYRIMQFFSTSTRCGRASSGNLLSRSSTPISFGASASSSSSVDYRLRLAESLSANDRLNRSVGALMFDKRRNWRVTAAILDVVMGYLDDADQLSAESADFLFRCCGRLTPAAPAPKRVQYLRTLWNSLPRLGLAHDLAAYVRLQQMLLQNQQMFSAAGFLERVRKGGYEPNEYLYVGSIIRCSMEEKPDFGEINGYMEALKQTRAGNDIWIKARGACTTAYARAKNSEKLRELLEEAKAESTSPQNNLALNKYYFSCASVSAQYGDTMTMFKMIDQARRSENPLTDYQLLYLVRFLAKSGRQDVVLRVLNYMPKADNWICRTLPFVLTLAADGFFVPALTVLQRSATAAAATAYPSVVSSPGQSSAEESQELLPKSENVYHFLLDLFYLNLPSTQITAFCRRLVDCGYSEDAFQLAAVAAFDVKRADAANILLEDAETRSSMPNLQATKTSEQSRQQGPAGSMLRPRHFWPALRIRSLLGDFDSILALLKRIETVGTAGVRTLASYVLRYFYSPGLDMYTIFAVFGTVGSRKVLLTAAVCVCLRQGDGRRAREFLNSCQRTHLLASNKELPTAVCEYYRQTYDSGLVLEILRRMENKRKEFEMWKSDRRNEDESATLLASIYAILKKKLSKNDLEDFVSALKREGYLIEENSSS